MKRVKSMDLFWEYTQTVTHVGWPDSYPDRMKRDREVLTEALNDLIKRLTTEDMVNLADIVRIAYKIGMADGYEACDTEFVDSIAEQL
jgi:hypothetical protein